MKGRVIKGEWLFVFLLFFSCSLIGNLISINLFQLRVQFLSNPFADAEVTKTFKEASSDLVANKSFSLKWGDKYYILVQTTKEMKEKFERLEEDKRWQ